MTLPWSSRPKRIANRTRGGAIGRRISTHRAEPTAFLGVFRTKRAYNDMPAALYACDHILNVGNSLFFLSYEVKYRAVMPNIAETGQHAGLCDACDQPANLRCSRSQALLRAFKRCLKDIEHCDILVSPHEQIINQRRFSATRIDDGCRMVRSSAFNKSERRLGMGTEPTNSIGSFGAVNSFPMSSHVHFTTSLVLIIVLGIRPMERARLTFGKIHQSPDCMSCANPLYV